MAYVICSENVKVRCAVGVSVQPYGYVGDAVELLPRGVLPYTVEHMCEMADLLDEIHHALVGN